MDAFIAPETCTKAAYATNTDDDFAEGIVKLAEESWATLRRKAETMGFYVKATIRRGSDRQVVDDCLPYYNEFQVIYVPDTTPTREGATALAEWAKRLGEAYEGMAYANEKLGTRVTHDAYGLAQ